MIVRAHRVKVAPSQPVQVFDPVAKTVQVTSTFTSHYMHTFEEIVEVG